MEIIQATEKELDELISFYQVVTDNMEENALTQWHWGRYPNEDLIRGDVKAGRLYYLREDDEIAAAVIAMTGQDPEYEKLSWTCGIRPGVFHRLAVHPSMQGAGLGGLVLDDVQQMLRRSGCDCVRCDASTKNKAAIRLYEKMGFRRCGSMQWEGAPDNYIIFDKPLKRETPIWPIRMVPAFRDGELTPWGGERLAELYGKETKDAHTGESLEVSCIPGLESTDTEGRKLPELIREFGEKLIGRCVDGPFPLLLKLIDAKEQPSVQVHPDDAYAAARENGKAGKNEAWLILDTPEEGGELIYGIRPGTGKQELRDACRKGEPEALLNRVRVRPGDVCYIPAGTVHSIGPGIVLYELGDTSEVTYRFYDWDRTDEQGKKRELQLDKALDVTNLKRQLSPVRVEKSYGVKRVLTEDSFTLDLLCVSGIETLPEIQNFGLLTVTEGELRLRWAGSSMKMKAGETCLLAKNSPELAVEGIGTAALAMPG
jgi:mannose-6-phosphate isomerase